MYNKAHRQSAQAVYGEGKRTVFHRRDHPQGVSPRHRLLSDQAEAVKALADYNRNPYDLSEKATFAEIYRRWTSEKFEELSDSRIRGYKSAFEACRAIHHRPLIELRLQDFQIIADQNAHLSETAARLIKTVISGVCEYAMKYDLITKDYSKFIKIRYTVAEQPKHRVFTKDEIQALWDAPRGKLRDITLILIYSGWRISELLHLSSVDTDTWVMTGGNKTRAGKNRIVPVHPRIRELIIDYKDGFGISASYVRDLMKEHYNDHTPHDTRHTFISILQSKGADHLCIERLVGHASKGVTDTVYTHKDIDELREVVELMP